MALVPGGWSRSGKGILAKQNPGAWDVVAGVVTGWVDGDRSEDVDSIGFMGI